jgi:hypothetical protein
VLPGALADQGVAVPEVNACQAEIHGGLLAGFIKREEQALGFVLVFGLEALKVFGGVVEGVVNALAAEEQAITTLHGS